MLEGRDGELWKSDSNQYFSSTSVIIIAIHQNILGNFKKFWCLGPSLKDYDVMDLKESLDTGVLKIVLLRSNLHNINLPIMIVNLII